MPSSNISPVETETRIAIPGLNYLNYLLASTGISDPDREINWIEWNDRNPYILPEIMEVARQTDQILEKLPLILGASKEIRLRSSITIPLPNGRMVALVSRDSKTGPFYSHSHDKFRWRERPVGIAGLCATTNQTILIPDLEKIPKGYKQSWIPSSSSPKVGGIVGLPLLKEVGNCRAVLTVSSKQRRFINEIHLGWLEQEIACRIESVLLNSRILPKPGAENLVDQLFYPRYDNAMGRENLKPGSEKSKGTNQVIDSLISELQDDARLGRKPVKAEDILRRFKDAGDKGISMGELSSFFEGESGAERNVTAFIAKLNSRYLNGHDLHIEGTTIYRIIKKPKQTKT